MQPLSLQSWQPLASGFLDHDVTQGWHGKPSSSLNDYFFMNLLLGVGGQVAQVADYDATLVGVEANGRANGLAKEAVQKSDHLKSGSRVAEALGAG